MLNIVYCHLLEKYENITLYRPKLTNRVSSFRAVRQAEGDGGPQHVEHVALLELAAAGAELDSRRISRISDFVPPEGRRGGEGRRSAD